MVFVLVLEVVGEVKKDVPHVVGVVLVLVPCSSSSLFSGIRKESSCSGMVEILQLLLVLLLLLMLAVIGARVQFPVLLVEDDNSS